VIVSDLAQNFTEGALIYWNMLCKRLHHYSQYSIFDGNSKEA